ncbi:death domain-containing protein 1 [Discoglossus pictus]
MEVSATNLTNSEDNLIFILTQINHYNQNVQEVLDGSLLKNNEDLEELIFSLISLIHDLSRTFRERLNKATESLQSTFQLIKRLHNQSKDFGSNDAQIDYLVSIKQILFDTKEHLRLSEEQLNNVNTKYKDTVDKAQKTNVAVNINNEGNLSGNKISAVDTEITQSFEFKMIQEEESDNKSNELYDETDNTVQMTSKSSKENSDYVFPGKNNKNEAHEKLQHMEIKDKKAKCDEPTEPVVDTSGDNNYKTKLEEHNIEQGSTSNKSKEDQMENTCNGTNINHSIENVSEPEIWTYKEFVSQAEAENEPKLACFIKAPQYILQQLQCKFLHDLSSLVVSDSEELVSSVLGIRSLNTDLKIPFPLTISIPFSSRYRGHYRDVMVKASDEKLHASYLTPISLEGHHGNHKGSFAEFKVYKLGIFSVVSCLKKESFTVLKKGLSLKLSMDSRISFNYPPGCFNSSVIVQFKVQPIDTSIISSLKVKHDIYHSVVSSSPLVYIKHPSVQVFQKSVTVFLPCPPNPEKKNQGEDRDNKRGSSARGSRITSAHQIRSVSASVRNHGDNPSEFLKLLAIKEDQWIILDDVVVKNVQNGIISFEMDEHPQSFIVIRLSSALEDSHLISFIERLEEATRSTMVNVVLYRKRDNLQKAIVKLVPSKELNWEIPRLREEGYIGPPEPSEQISLQEGEQIHFRFCGNITASDGQESGKTFKLTFHSQRKERLSLHLHVVDEFGNHSSPLYKGTVVFYKLSRADITTSFKSDLSTDTYLQQRTPVCKLALTLPKIEKNIIRPSSTKLTSSDPADILWDNMLHWLAQELSEEDASLLVLSLPVRRSTIQLVRLKSPDNLTEQIYELLSFWKKSLPTSADKLRLLARHLRKSGRSDLLEQLKLKWENNMFTSAQQHKLIQKS